MDDFSGFKIAPLRLKGEKKKKAKKRHHSRTGSSTTEGGGKLPKQMSVKEEMLQYGNWWRVEDVSQLGPCHIAIELVGAVGSHIFLSAMDNGKFQPGLKRPLGEGPEPEEQLSCVVISETKIALKSGYGKYIGLTKLSGEAEVVATSDAMGVLEQWEPVWQEGRCALQGANQRFLTVDTETDRVFCSSEQAKDAEMIVIRCNKNLDVDPKSLLPEEERSGVKSAELNYVKKFQSWQDKKLRLSKEESSQLNESRKVGKLHECLLDRREKMKADRYCK